MVVGGLGGLGMCCVSAEVVGVEWILVPKNGALYTSVECLSQGLLVPSSLEPPRQPSRILCVPAPLHLALALLTRDTVAVPDFAGAVTAIVSRDTRQLIPHSAAVIPCRRDPGNTPASPGLFPVLSFGPRGARARRCFDGPGAHLLVVCS